MSYLVEQLPHCDLLRLSLSTGWFVLSARQVVDCSVWLLLYWLSHLFLTTKTTKRKIFSTYRKFSSNPYNFVHQMKLGLRKIQKFTCYIGYIFVHLLYGLHLCAPRKNPFQSYPFLTLFAGLGTDILHLCAPNRATSLYTAAEIWVLTSLCTK